MSKPRTYLNEPSKLNPRLVMLVYPSVVGQDAYADEHLDVPDVLERWIVKGKIDRQALAAFEAQAKDVERERKAKELTEYIERNLSHVSLHVARAS